MSRVGKMPISIPGGVDLKIAEDGIEVKGPKGVLNLATHPAIAVNVAAFRFAGFVTGGVTAVSLSLSLQPLNAAAVVIAPSGKKGIPANHFRRSRRLG